MIDFVFDVLGFLVPLSSLLVLVIGVGALLPRHAVRARPLLRVGLIGAAIGAVAGATLFAVVPELALPGPGTLMVVLIFGFLGFGVTVIGAGLRQLLQR